MSAPRSVLVNLAAVVVACLLLAAGMLFAYLYLRSPRTVPAPEPTSTFTPTSIPATATATPTATPAPSATPDLPAGRIIYVCQLSGQALHDQICLMNADGSGFQRLTFDDSAENYYPWLAPDGRSFVYTSNRSGAYEIYEQDLATGTRLQLTHGTGEPAGSEISPDGKWIVFANDLENYTRIWLMNRDGSDPHQVYGRPGADSLDPTWSPDGSRILFASGAGTDKQLMTIAPDGSGLQALDTTFRTRGRTDWSHDGDWIASYAGSPWAWGIYLLHPDGTGLQQMQVGGVATAPSFSPDSRWVAFTGYLDHPNDPNGCEIYVMKLNGSQLTRLTYNNYCDWQPRWGP